MIRGVLIPFNADYAMTSLPELAQQAIDKLGFGTNIVEMDDETYKEICVKEKKE